MIKVLLAFNTSLTSAAFEKVLGNHSDLKVLVTYPVTGSIEAVMKENSPDIILLDGNYSNRYDKPDWQNLKKKYPFLKIIQINWGHPRMKPIDLPDADVYLKPDLSIVQLLKV